MTIRNVMFSVVALLCGSLSLSAQQPGDTLAVETPQADTLAASEWTRGLTLKTNIAGWALLMTNLAVEIDIIENLSFNLPVYYSGWDYGKNTLKLRTLTIKPE